jgi:hypothetical protein
MHSSSVLPRAPITGRPPLPAAPAGVLELSVDSGTVESLPVLFGLRGVVPSAWPAGVPAFGADRGVKLGSAGLAESNLPGLGVAVPPELPAAEGAVVDGAIAVPVGPGLVVVEGAVEVAVPDLAAGLPPRDAAPALELVDPPEAPEPLDCAHTGAIANISAEPMRNAFGPCLHIANSFA